MLCLVAGLLVPCSATLAGDDDETGWLQHAPPAIVDEGDLLVPPAPAPAPADGSSDLAATSSASMNRYHYSAGSFAEDSLEERLARLEAKLEEQEAADKPAEAAADDITMEWEGRIHLDHWGFPDESPLANAIETGDRNVDPLDRITFRRVRIAVEGEMYEVMVYSMQLEFGEPRDPQIRDAYLGWINVPFFQTVLLGNQKRPYSLDALNSSNVNVFLERPIVIDAFNENYRRVGLQSWNHSDDLAWNWRYGAFLMQDVQQIGEYKADEFQMEGAARLANTFWYDEANDGRNYAHWAVAAAVADPSSRLTGNPLDPAVGINQARFSSRPEARTDERWYDTGRIAGAQTYELLAWEGVVNLGPLSVVGELQNVWLQRDPDVGRDLSFNGGYVYVAYFLTGEHHPWNREEGTLGRPKPFRNLGFGDECDRTRGCGAWQVAARYSHSDLTNRDIAGGVGNSVTLALNWWWTPHSRLQFNYIHGHIDDHRPVAGFTSGSYDAFGTRFAIDF